MSDDYKTKILLEKSKQDKKANLFIKYIISIGFILFLSLVFFTFKEHFLSYFSLNLNEKNSFKEEKKKTAESKHLENNKNSSKKITSIMEIDISEECKIYNLEDKLCNLFMFDLLHRSPTGVNNVDAIILKKTILNNVYKGAKINERILENFTQYMINCSNVFLDKEEVDNLKTNFQFPNFYN